MQNTHEGYSEFETDEEIAMTPMVYSLDRIIGTAVPLTPELEMMPNGILCEFGDGREPIYFSYISAMYFSEALTDMSVAALKDTGRIKFVDAVEVDEE